MKARYVPKFQTHYLQLADGSWYQRAMIPGDRQTTANQANAARFRSARQAEWELEWALSNGILTEADEAKVVASA